MNQFTLLQGQSRELDDFPHINEFGVTKNPTVQLESFTTSVSDTLRIYSIIDGKFDWFINGEHYTLYPGDVAIILPGHSIGGYKGVLDIGALYRLHISVNKIHPNAEVSFGNWSGLSEKESVTIGQILSTSNVPVLKIKEATELLHGMHSEIQRQEIGYHTRVNDFIDCLLVVIARTSIKQAQFQSDFLRTLAKLEHALRHSLAHPWTVDEMAALVGLGTTAFTEKVKGHTGFSPFHYLIKIRISEAIKLLERPDVNFTSIALETGFYSSQHFSTTFKKLTGYTPGQFRKLNLVEAR